MKRKLRGLCVLVTGASSGIGRETALKLAARGARLVLTARREDALDDVARLCREKGAECMVVPADVSVVEEVEALAREAVAAFGQVDVWINNAGIYVMGTVEQTPLDVFNRVMEVNLIAPVAATKAILPHFRERRSGMFVNIASSIGLVTAPYLSAYAASKHALKAFSESLRDEVRELNIDVSVVYPTSTDTPLFEHSANYTGKAMKPAEPVYKVSDVADAILETIESPRRDVVIGAAKGMSAFRTVAPSLFDRVMSRKMEEGHFLPRRQGATDGNLWQPMESGTGSSAGWYRPKRGKKIALTMLAALAISFLVRALRA
jgi:short-subunit dehydrogenase